MCWNFSTRNLDIHKGSLVLGWLFKTVFPGAPRPRLRGTGAGSWATEGTTAQTEVCLYLLSDAWVGETSPKSLGIWCWIPQIPQRHFSLWMMLNYCCREGDKNERGLLLPWCQQHSSYFLFDKYTQTGWAYSYKKDNICTYFIIFFPLHQHEKYF